MSEKRSSYHHHHSKKKKSSKTPNTKEELNPPEKASSSTTRKTTTRVCIKNLPPSFTESQLSQHLLSSSSSFPNIQITDVKLLKTKTGINRKLAFVGFKNVPMANYVVDKFHNTYALTSKLIVEHAFSKKGGGGGGGEEEGEGYRPWSRHSKGSSRYKELYKQKEPFHHDDDHDDENKDKKVEEEEDAIQKKKMEFLSVMGVKTDKKEEGGGGKAKFWSNDDFIQPTNNGNAKQENDDDVESTSSESSSSSSSDDDSGSDDDLDSVDSGGEGANVMKSMSDMDFLRSKVTMVDNLTDNEEDDDDDGDDDDEKKAKTNKMEEEDSGSDSSSVPSSSDDEDSNDSSDEDSDDDDDDAEKQEDNSRKSFRNNDTTTTTTTNQEQEKKDETKYTDISTANANNRKMTPSRLFIRNLPFTTTEEELKSYFNPYGKVTECHIPVDDSKRSKGYAFLKFTSEQSAKLAMEELDKIDFQGRLIHILPARRGVHEEEEEEDHDTTDEEEVGNADEGEETNRKNKEKTHKQKQLEKRKKQASTSTTGLLSSFLRTDTILNNLSHRYNVQKSDLLNVKDTLASGDAAVRLALAETKIIEENRLYFGKHGIDLDVLANSATSPTNDNNHDRKKKKKKAGNIKRSTTMILVKNLPFDTTLEEVQKLCHGVVAAAAGAGATPSQILLPPSKSIALLQYGHVTDARRAFRKMAYKKFKHVPLYLEWAPLAAIVQKITTKEKDDSTTTTGDDGKDITPSKNEIIKDIKKIHNDNDDDDHEEPDTIEPASIQTTPGVSHTIYIKNINFQTTEENLYSFFEKHLGQEHVLAVKIPKKVVATSTTKKQPRQQKELSMGFGFVECTNYDIAKRSIKKLQGVVLDGHALELKLSNKSIVTSNNNNKTKANVVVAANANNNKKNAKLMVRNVPFEATRKELLQLFGSFGQLKKIRLPKKFNGSSHRGFAFVEFVTSQEAVNAMKSLSSTHLYGRHLVLEWAEEEDTTNDVDVRRGKAKRDLMSQTGGSRGGGGGALNLDAPRQNKKIRFT